MRMISSLLIRRRSGRVISLCAHRLLLSSGSGGDGRKLIRPLPFSSKNEETNSKPLLKAFAYATSLMATYLLWKWSLSSGLYKRLQILLGEVDPSEDNRLSVNADIQEEPLSPVHDGEEEEVKEQTPLAKKTTPKRKKVGFREQRIIEYENRLRAYSTPDKIFRYFATLKVPNEDGTFDVFMTPEDFVRSLTPGVMQPRRWGLDKFKVYNPHQQEGVGVSQYTGKDTIFHWIGDNGLISFGDYLFLMTLLATPPSEFRLAFHVFDVNGDGVLDREEFEGVQELVLSTSNVGQRHRDHSTGSISFKKNKHSAVTKHFFGTEGDKKLNIDRFLQFQHDLHRDILKIEFDRRDPHSHKEEGVITEISFAQLLLLHASLPEKRQKRMMKRVRRRFLHAEGNKGITFFETCQYFSFLYHIDKVDMALHFYKLAGRPLNKELLQRLARKITGVEISDGVVEVLVALFDENGDGQLSQQEFVSVMKKRMQRGLERPKDTGFIKLADAAWECTKKKLGEVIAG